MKLFRTALFALAALALVPAVSFGQTQGATTPAPAAKATPAPAAKPAAAPAQTPKATTHAIAGVVKSMDATSLVITTTATAKEKAKDVTFVLNAATQKKGAIAAGAMADVRYTTEGDKNVATAVSVQEKKK